jgi:L-ascorbate oxidase
MNRRCATAMILVGAAILAFGSVDPQGRAEQRPAPIESVQDEAPSKELVGPLFELWSKANERCEALLALLSDRPTAEAVKAGQVLLKSQAFENPPEAVFDGKPIAIEVKIRDFSGIVEDRMVRLRTFNGLPVGPTIRVKPNDLLKIKVVNHDPLPKDELRLEDPDEPKDDNNHPNRFSTTNLHTHGLKVSPVAPADDIFASVKPGEERIYQYPLKNHHPGTCWYHPHRHGSTAIQLCNGMAGALIVEPEADTPSLEAILKSKKVVEEKIFVFQEIRCSREVREVAAGETPVLKPTREDVYGAKSVTRDGKPYEVAERFLINGKHLPIVRMKPDQVQRWRCIHAGIDRRLGLVIVKQGSEQDRKTKFPLYCTATDSMMLPEVATQTFGGATGEDANAKQQELFSLLPGNRSDFLVQLPTGVYILQAARQDKEFNSREQGRDVVPLAILFVEKLENRKVAADASVGLAELVEDLGRMTLPGALKQKPPTPVTGFKTIQFQQGGGRYQVRWKKDDEPTSVETWKWREFSGEPSDLDIVVQAGTTERWTLESEKGNHPFHIHVNPFYVRDRIRKIKTRNGGREIEVQDSIDQWHDTVLVAEGEPVVIFIRFERGMTGDTVFHCHNLDHEDKGMMMRVRIEDPDKKVAKKTYGFKSLPISAPAMRSKLEDQHGKMRQLKEFAFNKEGDHADLLLVFVRSVECEHCFEQLKAIEANLRAFKDHKLNVVAVCPDDREAAAKAKKLPFPVLFDPKLVLFNKHQCSDGKNPIHATCFIDRNSVVRWEHADDTPLMKFDAVLELCRKGPPLEVSVSEFKFEPETLDVRVGQTVEWVHSGDMTHSAWSKIGFNPKIIPPVFEQHLFVVSPLKSGNRVAVLFTEEHYRRAGGKDQAVELEYFCYEHPQMKGKIKLLPRSAP